MLIRKGLLHWLCTHNRDKKSHVIMETYSCRLSLVQRVQEYDGVGAASNPAGIFFPATLSIEEDPVAHLPCLFSLSLRPNPSQ